MMKKNCLKILLISGLVLFAMCMFYANSSIVYATDEEYIDNLLSMIPDTIELDISEKQAMWELASWGDENLTANKALKEKINSIFTQNNIDVSTLEEQNINLNAYTSVNLKKGEITITYDVITTTYNGNSSKSKTIDIIYNNSNSHNVEEENKILDTIKNNMPKYYTMTLDTNGNRILDEFEVVEDYYNKLLNDSSITINVLGMAGDGGIFMTNYDGYIQVFKDDLFCGTVDIDGTKILWFDKIIIPENVEDTPEAYINYSLPIVKKALSRIDDKEISLKAGYDDFNDTYKNELSACNIDNLYTVYIDNEALGEVILEKEKSNINLTDTTTNIKLETDTSTVSSDVKLIVKKISSGDTYNNVKEVLKDKVSKMYVYDISLKSNNVEVQPEGKVKVSIPIPEGFDKSNLAVYRIEENGTNVEYDVSIVDDYAVFETDHFSTYVLAEKTNVTTQQKDDEQTQNTTSEHIKDETPKTGTNDISTIVCSILSVLSSFGIAIVKKF